MFDWLNQNKNVRVDKTNKSEIFVCKHCKLSCKDCESTFCFNCFTTEAYPCPRCGKRNSDPVVNETSENKDDKTSQ